MRRSPESQAALGAAPPNSGGGSSDRHERNDVIGTRAGMSSRDHASMDGAPSMAQETVPEAVLDKVFRHARSQNGWLSRPVDRAMIRRIYDLAKMAPTSMNGQPMRVIFLCTAEAKERLRPALTEANVSKALTAPVVAVIGYDEKFYERFAEVFPHRPEAAEIFRNDQALARTTAFRNGTIQAAYLILAARALGLDCGPMSGFDHAAVEEMFFQGTHIRINFLCGLGYGDREKLYERLPRLDFDAACTLA